MTRFFRFIKNEAKSVAAVFFFFLISFIIINETESFLFKKAGIHPFTLIDLIVAAALVAKIFIVLDHLPVSKLFIEKPLIYHIIPKTVLYWLVAFLVRMSIRFFHYLILNIGLEVEWHDFYTSMNWNLVLRFRNSCDNFGVKAA
jgi:hypothetical protein